MNSNSGNINDAEQKKTLHMIGHSHIDPVWFWRYQEGLQEIKATYRSVLDRMDEFEDFKYTSSSTSFLKWIKELDIYLFNRIREKIIEGRWEMGGGWYNEPDCHLPTGEFFVRQGLYGQRFLCKEMGFITNLASNVDSFGHGPYLPMFLRHCKMKNYVFMRPRLKEDVPVFNWKSPDDSKVKAISLPSEYTTWFDKTIRESIDICKEKLEYQNSLPCYYGVGNHGGGPTIENIKSVKKVATENKDINIYFSNLKEYFDSVKSKSLKDKVGIFEGVNTGCYTIDLAFKKAYRKAEEKFLLAERMHALAYIVTGNSRVNTSKWQELAEIIMFNQFHDVLGGTYTLQAREDGLNQLKGVVATTEYWLNLAIQDIANTIDTKGEGFPLILFNPSDKPFKGVVYPELNFFCLSDLKLTDNEGKEIVYQRVKTDCTMMNYNLGGRRKICFQTQIPAMGFVIYRAHETESSPDSISKFPPENEVDENNLVLENSKIRVEIGKDTGTISYISQKDKDNILSEPMKWEVWKDQRDSWGHDRGEDYSNTGEYYKIKEIAHIESGPIREIVRAYFEHKGSILRVLYILNKDEDFITMDCHLVWDKPWHQLQLSSPIKGTSFSTAAEIAGGVWKRASENKSDENDYTKTKVMHRFVDIYDNKDKHGLLIVNDGIYGFTNFDNKLNLSILRSSIYAQAHCVGWYHKEDTYDYTDLGEHRFKFLVKPHNGLILEPEMYALAENISNPPQYLFDCWHLGSMEINKEYSLASVESPCVKVLALKISESGKDLVIRLKEVCGKSIQTRVKLGEHTWMAKLKKNSIATYRIHNNRVEEVNGLEWLEDRGCEDEEDYDDRQ